MPKRVPQPDSGRPTLLFVVHSWGGGAIRYARELRDLVAGSVNVVFAWGVDDRSLHISTHDPEASDESFDLPQDLEKAAARLRALNVRRADLLCTIGLQQHIEALLQLLDTPYDVTFLGYELLAENVHLMDEQGRFVGDDVFAQPNARLAATGSLLRRASRRITCSRDLALRASRIAPDFTFIPARLPERIDPHTIAPRLEEIIAGEPLRILVLGRLAAHKGFDVVCDVARRAAAADAPIEITCLGQPQVHASVLAGAASRHLRILGAFKDDELNPIIGWLRPHLAWLPFVVPETHSFALSDVVARGLPLLATAIGAIPERVQNRPATWLVPIEEANAETFFRWLVRLFDEKLAVTPFSVPVDHLPPLSECFYERDYLSPLGISPIDAPYETGARGTQACESKRRGDVGNESLGLRLIQERHDLEMQISHIRSTKETERDNLRREYERRLASEQQLLEAKEELSRMGVEVERFRKEYDCRLVAADQDLRRLVATVEERDQRLVAADQGLRRLTREVEERDQRLVEADQGLRRLAREVEERDQRLVEADRGLRRLAREVAERDQRLAQADHAFR